MDLRQKYHLISVGLAFTIFTIIILTDSYNYFILDKHYEGYIIAFKLIIFDLIGLILMILFIIKKDFINIGKVGLLYLGMNIIGFLGFNISLSLMPILGIISIIIIFNIKNINCS